MSNLRTRIILDDPLNTRSVRMKEAIRKLSKAGFDAEKAINALNQAYSNQKIMVKPANFGKLQPRICDIFAKNTSYRGGSKGKGGKIKYRRE